MGIVNATPDSFSDGGRFATADEAVAEGERQLAAGAAIIDVGGESSRPGAGEVTADEERRRVLPVIAGLRRRQPRAILSVDTTKVEVAEAAFDAGADLVNDVSAGSAAGMLELVAGRAAGIVLMHRRGTPTTMQNDTRYDDVVAEVHAFLRERATAAARAGIAPDRIWLDPGIGFGKDDDGNLALLAALPALATIGHPVVVGPSRKAFIGRLTGAAVDDRLGGTLAALIPAVGLQRVAVRVHDVGPAVQFLTLAGRLSGVAA
ncbi:MAG: dihydropteroate synthase [Holophagae bacterium]|jgi:dihydropteroate synthase